MRIYSKLACFIGGVLFGSVGIKLLSSMQGQLGLDLARQHAPQLILLDLNLPDLQGLEVLQRLRRLPATVDTPILIYIPTHKLFVFAADGQLVQAPSRRQGRAA